MARHDRKPSKGISLAKGPIGLIGLAMLAYGITALMFGGHSFATHAIDGTVNGKTWLGLEVNPWSSLLFVAAGGLLMLGAPLHWGAKAHAMLVGLALGAASVIATIDGNDVFGIFAANGLTKLVWGAGAVALLLLALLPRVGDKRHEHQAGDGHGRREPVRDSRRFDRERLADDQPGARPASVASKSWSDSG